MPAARKTNKKTSGTQKLLNHLKSGKTITARQAKTKFKFASDNSARSRISELKGRGNQISNRNAGVKGKTALYSL